MCFSFSHAFIHHFSELDVLNGEKLPPSANPGWREVDISKDLHPTNLEVADLPRAASPIFVRIWKHNVKISTEFEVWIGQ